MAKTLVVITGGTIEALYNVLKGTPYYVPVPKSPLDSVIPAALEKLGLFGHADIYPLAMKDSKEVETAHLDHILHKIATEGYSRVVITHGTDTMPIHARYLKRKMAEYGSLHGMDEKTIVFTGAMGPMRGKNGKLRDPAKHTFLNDGWDNLKRAFTDVKDAKPGVYIEMGNGPWEADTIRKQIELNDDPDVRVAKVAHSGFVADDPKRHEIEIF